MSDTANKLNIFSVHHKHYPTDPEIWYFKVFVDVPSSIRAVVLDRLLMKAAKMRVFYGVSPKEEICEYIKVGPLTERDMQKIRQDKMTRLWQGTFFTKTWLVNGVEIPVAAKCDLNPEVLTEVAKSYKGVLY
jgi:hypothetical protein